MYVFGSPARLFLALALAVVTLAVPTWSFAQAPTFNGSITTPKGGESWFQPIFAAVGDFNGDGKLDALVSDAGPNLRLMLGHGNGTFSQSNVSAPATNPGMIRAADLNGDGRLDAVTVSNGAFPSPVTVVLNTGNDGNGVPQFAVTNFSGGFNEIRSLSIGDLNGDGDPDLVIGNSHGSLRVFLNDGSGAFTLRQSTSMQPSGGSAGGGAIADLNGDDKADYVVTSNQAGATNVFFGNGDGTLQPPVVILNSTTSIAVADVNGDGGLDLLAVANGVPNQLLVYLNTGGGSFSAPTVYSTGGTAFNGWTSVAAADMNGDGKLEVVTTNSGSNNVAVFLGDGSGTFGAPALFTVNVTPFDVALQDFNGDSKPDIATVGHGNRTYGVALNTTVLAPPDTTAPVISGAADIVAEATGPGGAEVTFTPTAEDDVDGPADVAADPESGSLFPIGDTTVELSASDAAGNSATASFTVTVRDTIAPAITSLPADHTIEATSAAGAVATFGAAEATDAVGVVSITYSNTSGSTFQIGATTVTVTATDAAGNASSAQFVVTVRDTTAPAIGSVSPSQATLWAPNHQMVPINVTAVATDAVGVTSLKIVNVTSSEPDDGLGDGDTAGDLVITGPLSVNLRAERSGRGNGRTYTITVEARDAAGNASTKICTVVVPKSRGR